MRNEIDYSLVQDLLENYFDDVKESLYKALVENINENVRDVSLNDFFNYLINRNEVEGFINSDNDSKLKIVLAWFKQNKELLEVNIYESISNKIFVKPPDFSVKYERYLVRHEKKKSIIAIPFSDKTK